MVPEKRPDSILIVGAGAIGIEFASFYNDFGTEVTVVEAQEHILPSEDKEISIFANKCFEENLKDILLSISIYVFISSHDVLCTL